MMTKRPSVSATSLLLAVVLWIVVAGNQQLWNHVGDIAGPGALDDFRTFASFFLFLASLFTLVLAPAAHRAVFKPLAIVLLLVVAVVAWFQDSYGTIVDRDIIRSALETDRLEAGELLTAGFAGHLALYWLMPSTLVLWVRLEHPAGLRLVARAALVMLLSTVTLIATVWAGYRSFSVLGREHTELRMLVNPAYAIYSAVEVLAAREDDPPTKLIPVAADATRLDSANARPRVVVFVLGETARADHFQLNGYPRETNPGLSGSPVINFPRVSSCGTSTAVSVPCIFSIAGRDSFDVEDSRRHENLLHVLQRSGVRVLWRENNTGCKGVCDDFELDNFRNATDRRFCDRDGCVDEIMLADLEERILESSQDMFIVMHQAGSHGPAYYRRYPDEFRVFEPECRSDAPESCTTEELINSYDNSILYTDHFLDRLIGILDGLSAERSVSMIYASDHGESLGENGLFLHGLPYAIAPESQTHVPMIMWVPATFAGNGAALRSCLQERATEKLSHDNLFPTMLSLFGVHSQDTDSTLNLVDDCDRRLASR